MTARSQHVWRGAALVTLAVAALAASRPGAGGAAPGPRLRTAIAFTRTTPAPWTSHLFAVDPGGSGLRQLTGGDVIDVRPVWSPDGRRIAFTRRAKAKGSDIFVVAADGSGLRQLTHTGTSDEPDWSPDGKTIAYVSSNGLSVMTADGRHQRLLTAWIGGRYPVRSPTWSPDGTTIAYANRAGQIFVIRGDGSLARRLSNGASFACPAWSPDGRKVAFDVQPLRYDRIYVANLSGDGERLVTRRAYTESGFAWSPDGRRIVYAREKGGGIYSVAIDGSGDRRLTRNPLRRDLLAGAFSWSPDGRRVAYASDVTGDGDIYVMDADGRSQRQLTSGPEIDGSPEWSHSPLSASC